MIGPVRLPAAAERLAAARAAPVLRRLRLLAEYCSPPGRGLTAAGNLRLADARHLVVALETGDGPRVVAPRGLRSAADLPGLSRLVDLAIEVGAVRRQRGLLLAVARFAELDDVTAHERVVPAVVEAGLGGPHGASLPALAPLHAAVDRSAVAMLATLLASGGDGVEVDELGVVATEFVAHALPGLAGMLSLLGPDIGGSHLERLADLGIVTISGTDATICADCGLPDHQGAAAVLTAAGVPIAVDLVERAGVEVLVAPEPATAGVAEIVDLAGVLDEPRWTAEVSAWLAAQPDPTEATVALVAEITAGHRDSFTVMAGIGLVDALVGDRAVDAVRSQLGGPHDGLVLHWLIGKSAVDPTSVDPARFVGGLVDVLAATLDVAGPAEVATLLVDGPPGQQCEILDAIWRVDHPRLSDVLDALGAHHPDKQVAKAARKAQVRLRSRLAGLPG